MLTSLIYQLSYLTLYYSILECPLSYTNHEFQTAYFFVHYLAFFSAWVLFDFHSSAASLFRGSRGFGSAKRLWIDNKTDLICRAGDQFFFKISKHILPKLSLLLIVYLY